MSKITSDSFVSTISVNVDNNKMSDEEFRNFIRNTLPIVDCSGHLERAKKDLIAALLYADRAIKTASADLQATSAIISCAYKDVERDEPI